MGLEAWQESGSLWHHVIEDKFGKASTRWQPKKSHLSQGTGCWQRILSGTTDLNNHIRFTVNSGVDVRLWLDNWIDGGTLAELYPNLFSISKQKRNSIASFVSAVDQTLDFKFSRQLTEEEEEDLFIIKGIIGPVSALSQLLDGRHWLHSPNGIFDVRSCYEAYTSSEQSSFPSKFIWNNRLPSKMNFFLWTAAHSKCLTQDNLRRRGLILVNGCLLCKSAEETVEHLLLHCPIAWQVWSRFNPLLHWSWVVPEDVMALAQSWEGLPCWSPSAKYIWSLVPGAICWSLWLERNARVNKGEAQSIDMICNNIKSLILSWSVRSEECRGLTFQQFNV